MKRAKRNFKYKSSSRTFLSSFDLGLKSSTPKNCGGWKESSRYVRLNAHIADTVRSLFFGCKLSLWAHLNRTNFWVTLEEAKKWASFFSQMQLPELFSDVEDLLNRTISFHHVINVLVNQIKMSSSIGIFSHWIDAKNIVSLSPSISILSHWIKYFSKGFLLSYLFDGTARL